MNKEILAAVREKTAELAALEPREGSGELFEDFAAGCSIEILLKERLVALFKAYSSLKTWLSYRDDETLFCYGAPSHVHEGFPGLIIITIALKLGQRQLPVDFFDAYPSPGCIIGTRTKMPDMSFCPRPRDLARKMMDAKRNPFPTLIVEFAVTNESLKKLKSFLELWLSDDTDVQMAIGTKLFALRKATKERRLAILSRKRGDSSFQEAEFLLNFETRKAVRLDTDGPAAIEVPIRKTLFHGSSRNLSGYQVKDSILLDLSEAPKPGASSHSGETVSI